VNWADGPVTVQVPATSANLGPGFDALGLALAWHNEVTATVTGVGLGIEVTGQGVATAHDGERHLVVRAMHAAFEVIGQHPPGLALRCVNRIPQARGLGSSAAAIVSGILAARALAGPDGIAALPDLAVARLATEIEGHPDNVTACLAGDLVISWTAPDGAHFTRLATVPQLAPVLCLPAGTLATTAARQALPAAVPHADAAANAGRAALLIAALTADPALLLPATEDYLHQRYRAPVMPATAQLTGALRAAGVPAVVSGAGPAVLALTVTGPGLGSGQDEVAAVAARSADPWEIVPLPVDRSGAVVQP
jgi:homoserine kinase